jgi:pyruvate dehydrogenase E1 component alpha subunit
LHAHLKKHMATKVIKENKATTNGVATTEINYQTGKAFDGATYLQWYELMYKARRFEEMAGMLYGQQKIRGFCHLYIGQEALAAGSISATQPADAMITAYRCHALGIAKGITCNEAMAELYGKATGCSKGKGGSMHFFSKEHNFYGGHGIVGAQIPLGAGIAFADKYKGNNNVTLCFFGDGAAWQGALHETFNLASLWKIPVIFICENNGYAMGTSVKRSTRVIDFYKLGEVYDIASEQVDGMRCEDVHNAIARGVERGRKGEGPTFLEIKTYRYKGHSMSDPQKYRSKDEVEEYKRMDPVEVVKETILKHKFATEKAIEAINEKIEAEIEACVQFAEESPFPENSELLKDIYAEDNYPFITE